MIHKYSKSDFKLYKKQCLYWIDKFGITEYEIDFKHHKLDGNSCARTTYNIVAKLACFQLTKFTEGEFCLQSNIDKLALHEVIHLLLADFGKTIEFTKDADNDLVIAQEHAVVQRLLKAFDIND